MGNFRSDNQGRIRDRSSSSRFGRSRGFGGRGGFGDRDSGRSRRKPFEMYKATCSKCGEQCQVPFRPTGNKPVFCSDCFKKNEDSGRNFGSRNQDRPSQSGMSSEQFNQFNAKLDRIIEALELNVKIGKNPKKKIQND